MSGKRDNIKVTAIVSVRMSIELTQPWSQGVGMDEIHRQAKDSAQRALGVILGTKDAKGVNARITHDIGTVRIITEDVE